MSLADLKRRMRRRPDGNPNESLFPSIVSIENLSVACRFGYDMTHQIMWIGVAVVADQRIFDGPADE